MQRYMHSFGWSFVITNLLSVLLVISKEQYPGLLNWMTAMTTHHWISHSILVLACFMILGYLMAPLFKKNPQTYFLAFMIILSTIVGGLLVGGSALVAHYL